MPTLSFKVNNAWTNILSYDANTSNLIKPLAVGSGGTGANNRITGLNNLAFLGANITANAAADTRAFWQGKGTGYVYYNAAGRLQGQPKQYGILVNLVYSYEIVQIWCDCGANSGAAWMYLRAANNQVTAMSGWTKVITTNSIQTYNYNASGWKIFLRKIESIVVGTIIGPASASTGWIYAPVSLPAGWRPVSMAVHASAYCVDAAGNNTARGYIATNGQISVQHYGGVNSIVGFTFGYYS